MPVAVMAEMRDHCQQHGDNRQPHHRLGRQERNFACADQGSNAGDRQKQWQMQDAMAHVAVPVMAIVMVSVVVAVLSSAMAVGFRPPFIERKFVAHAEFKFTHKSP